MTTFSIQKTIGTLLFLLIASIVFAQAPINTQKIDNLFDTLQKNDSVMGSIAIAKNGKVMYERQIGYSYINGNEKIPANTETKYRIGSNTKMFTSAIIFQLIDEGKLSLDTKLSKFYPQIPGANKIDIDMLLSHRSGLFDYVNDSINPNTGIGWLAVPQTDANILSVIVKGKKHFEPGEKFRYCNSGYWLLGNIIQKIEHEPFNKVVAQRVFDKLHLNMCTDSVTIPAKNEAVSYIYDNGWKPSLEFNFNNTRGAGEIVSSPTEMVQFIQGLIDGKLISKKDLAIMMKPRADARIGMYEFGMGLATFRYKNHVGYGHAGGTVGSVSIVLDFKSDKLTIVLATNGLRTSLENLFTSVLEICFNQPSDKN